MNSPEDSPNVKQPMDESIIINSRSTPKHKKEVKDSFENQTSSEDSLPESHKCESIPLGRMSFQAPSDAFVNPLKSQQNSERKKKASLFKEDSNYKVKEEKSMLKAISLLKNDQKSRKLSFGIPTEDSNDEDNPKFEIEPIRKDSLNKPSAFNKFERIVESPHHLEYDSGSSNCSPKMGKFGAQMRRFHTMDPKRRDSSVSNSQENVIKIKENLKAIKISKKTSRFASYVKSPITQSKSNRGINLSTFSEIEEQMIANARKANNRSKSRRGSITSNISSGSKLKNRLKSSRNYKRHGNKAWNRSKTSTIMLNESKVIAINESKKMAKKLSGNAHNKKVFIFPGQKRRNSMDSNSSMDEWEAIDKTYNHQKTYNFLPSLKSITGLETCEIMNEIPLTITTNKEEKLEGRIKRSIEQFKEHGKKQIEYVEKLLKMCRDFYNNYLDMNEKSVLITTKMIRFFTIVIQSEENILNSLKMPKLGKIGENCSESTRKETGLELIDKETSRLVDSRNYRVIYMKTELGKIRTQVHSELIEKNKKAAKLNENDLKKNFSELERVMMLLKNRLISMNGKYKVVIKSLKKELKSKKSSKVLDEEDKGTHEMRDIFKFFILVLRRVEMAEETIVNMLTSYEVYWKQFKKNANHRLSQIKKILQSYLDYQKNSFFDTIKLQKLKRILDEFKGQKNQLKYDDKLLIKSKYLKELGIDGETLTEIKENIVERFKKMPYKLEFCVWDHFNPNLYEHHNGGNKLKYRFFLSNENYFYVYEVASRLKLPESHVPFFWCGLKNLRYCFLKDQGNCMYELRLKRSKSKSIYVSFFVKDMREIVDLMLFLSENGQVDEQMKHY